MKFERKIYKLFEIFLEYKKLKLTISNVTFILIVIYFANAFFSAILQSLEYR